MSTNAIGNILLFVATKGMQLTARFAAMLADEYILSFLFAIRSSPGATFNVQLFVVNFIFSLSRPEIG